MSRSPLSPASSLVLACSLAIASCHPTERFESVCQVIRTEVVETKADGAVEMLDVELEWDPCPGEQYQVVRGGAEFAACMKQHKVGDLVPVEVVHFWDRRGYYRWDLTRVGACERPVQPDVEGSYEKSQECHEVFHHGRKAGFMCSRKPFRDLVEVCPWLARD